MILSFEDLSPNEVYYTLIQSIVPRPIAWVLSENANLTHNLAPFSYFNGVSSNPPLVSISVGRRIDGSQKDTWHGILALFRRNVCAPQLFGKSVRSGDANNSLVSQKWQ